jgi:hypothetical protein
VVASVAAAEGWYRFGAACLIAPAAPAFAVFVPAAIASGDPNLQVAFLMIAWYGTFSFPLALVLGLPTYLLLGWRRWTGLLVYVGAGTLLGTGAGLAILLLADNLIVLTWISLVSGPFIAACFWLIARPDRHNLVWREHADDAPLPPRGSLPVARRAHPKAYQSMKVRRYWFEFEKPEPARPAWPPFGCGVSAWTKDDAIAIMRQTVFAGRDMPRISHLIEDVDIRDLEQNHVVPNMGIVSERGVWYPRGFETLMAPPAKP